MKRSVTLALLSNSGRPEGAVYEMIMVAMAQLQAQGIDVHYSRRFRDSVLVRARNAFVSDFLNDPANTDLILLDDDNHCAGAELVRLVNAPADVIGLPIRIKEPLPRWNVGFMGDRPLAPDADGQLEVLHVGTGIMRIKRSALEWMVSAMRNHWYCDKTTPAGKSIALFENEIVENELRGEDETFCRRFRAIGGHVHVLPDVVTHHLGMQDFSGSLSAYLAASSPRIEIVAAGGASKSMVDNGFAAKAA